jgi:hypothetical protein
MEVPVKTLPERSNIDHLRKQAKELLRDYRRHDAVALERFRNSLPSARGKNDTALIALELKLHDAQSCIAREHGFDSWTHLKARVEWQEANAQDLAAARLHWLRLVYGGPAAGGDSFFGRPALAAKLLEEKPELVRGDAHLACAIGDEVVVRAAIAADPAWANRTGGVLDLPPLVAVTHSTLGRLESFVDGMRRCVRLLLDAGAHPDQSIGNRIAPASVEQPDEKEQLSALYGAAGNLHDPSMTQMLLEAGANPNDGESLYHSLDDPNREWPCARLLLGHGAIIERANAVAKALDFDNLDGLRMILGARKEPPRAGSVLWAIWRRRSSEHVQALLDAGADAHEKNEAGQSAFKLAIGAGLTEVADVLRAAGASEPITLDDEFMSACARVDENAARRIQAARPDLPRSLSDAQLRELPILAMNGSDASVRLMVELGWPIGARGGDIDGSALNWAVFRGDVALTGFLLAHGASWREPHRYGSDVVGTLSWASLNEPRDDGDWVGCARAMLVHGLPRARRQDGSSHVLIDGRRMTFAPDVAAVLLGSESASE